MAAADKTFRALMLAGVAACAPPGMGTDEQEAVTRLAISEIMYHPVLEESVQDEHEFVELHSPTGRTVSLGGWKLAGGIAFTFPTGVTLPPAGYLVVASNRAKLAAVTGYGLRAGDLQGDFTGQLSNDGDRIVLQDPAGQTVDQVKYDDQAPWPLAADALGGGENWLPAHNLPLERHRYRGRSLERISFTLPASEVANWAPSALDGATPGRPNGAAGVPRAIALAVNAVSEGGGAGPIRSDDAVAVQVRFSSVGQVSAAQVEYFVDDVERTGEPTTKIPLTSGPEGHQARLPAHKDNAIVRYRILGDRGAGTQVVSPRESDPYAWHSYFVSPLIEGSTAVYQLFVAQADWTRLWDSIDAGRVPDNINGTNPEACALNEDWNLRVPAVFVSDGQVFDVRVRYEGSHQNRKNGANIDAAKWPSAVAKPAAPVPFRALSWSIKFPRYRRFEGKRSFNLNKLTQSCQGFRTSVGGRLFEQVGVPAARTQHTRLYINGAYYHYMQRLEHMDEDMLRRSQGKDHPIGDLFKVVGGRWDAGPYGWSDGRLLAPYCGYSAAQRYDWSYKRMTWKDEKKGSREVQQMLEKLHVARAAGLPALRKFFADEFDLELLTSYMAILNWVAPWDETYHNHYLYRRSNGRWMMMPTDMDNTFGGSAPSAGDASFFIGAENVRSNRNDYWNYLKDSFLRAYRTEFLNRIQEFNRTTLHADEVAAAIDEEAAGYVLPEATASPAGMSCNGRPAEQITSMKSFARTRALRIEERLFD